MDPRDSRHGTYAGAQTHWREDETPCDPCRAAVRRYQKRRKYDVANNRPRKVDATIARRHLQQLADQGMTDGAIAERSGVNITIVRHARVGLNDLILTSTEAALLGVEAAPHPQGWVDGTGSRRRIQALAALGWTKRDIVAAAARAGHEVTYAVLGWVAQSRATNGRVRVQTRDAIAAAYEDLSMRLPESNRSSNRAKAWAKAAGHPPPLAWDDATIDDPDAKPIGYGDAQVARVSQYASAKTRAIDLAELDERGVGISEACRVLNVSREALQQWCKRKGLSDVYRRLAMREDYSPNGSMGAA